MLNVAAHKFSPVALLAILAATIPVGHAPKSAGPSPTFHVLASAPHVKDQTQPRDNATQPHSRSRLRTDIPL